MNKLILAWIVILPAWLLAQSYDHDSFIKKINVFSGYTGKKTSKTQFNILNDNSVSMLLNKSLRVEFEVNKNFVLDSIYSIEISLYSTVNNLSGFGLSFMEAKGKSKFYSYYDADINNRCNESELIETPYVRFIDSIPIGKHIRLNYIIIGRSIKQNGTKIILRKIPRIYNSTSSSIRNTELITDLSNDTLIIGINKIKCIGAINSIDKENFITNGGFEYFYLHEPPVYTSKNSYKNVVGWQKTLLVPPTCIDSRNVNPQKLKKETTVNVNTENGKVIVSSKMSNIDLSTADFYHDFAIYDSSSHNLAYEGLGFAGIIVSDKKKQAAGLVLEYLQSEINTPLIKGKKYKISFFYRLGPSSRFATNVLGLKIGECAFSVDKEQIFNKKLRQASYIISDEVIVNLEWKEASYVFIAKGNEKYLTIGAFQQKNTWVKYQDVKPVYGISLGSGLAYYLIDKVSLVEVEK